MTEVVGKIHKFIQKLSDRQILFILFLLATILYINVFSGSFLWDDEDFVYRNAYVTDISNWPKYFSENLIAGAGKVSDYYRPILLFSFAFDHILWALNPFGFHITSLLLHVSTAFLAYLLIKKLFENKELALLTSVLFVVHPLHTEAVSYIAGRGDMLYSTFLLLTIVLYFKAQYSLRKKKNTLLTFKKFLKNKYFLISILSLIFGLLSKELAIVTPILLLLAEVVKNREEYFKKFDLKRSFLKLLNRISVYFFVTFVYGILRLTVLNFSNTLNLYGETNEYTSNVFLRLFTFCKVLFEYFVVLIFPMELHMERSVETISGFFNIYVIGAILIIGLVTFLSIKYFKKNSIYLFGLFWFFINLAPTSGITPINGIIYEHFLYLASIGFFLVIAYGFLQLLFILKNKNVVYFTLFILLSIISALGVRTILRNEEWKDPVKLYNQTLEYAPESIRVHNNLGMEYSGRGMIDEAIAEYEKAIEIQDVYPNPHHNLANLYLERGEYEKAVEEFERVFTIQPEFFFSYDLWTKYLLSQERYEEAIEVQKRAVEAMPNNPQYVINIGVLYTQIENYDSAIEYLHKSLSLLDSDSDLYIQIEQEIERLENTLIQ